MTRAELEQIAREAAAQYNLPVDVFLRLIQQESGFDPAAVSPKGAIGPAQLMPDTAKELGVNPNNVRENIFGGAKYLSQQLSRFGEMPLALAAYNAGPTRVARLGRIPNIPETQNYIKAILGSLDGQPLSATRNNAMVGNMQTPPIFPQQQQQQQGGLRGLLSSFMQPNQTTGLTGPENLAQALDALILPEARMGEQIRARGAQRLQSQSRNKTIETLKQRAAQGDKLAAMVLQGLQSGAYDAKTAMSLYMGKMLETPKDDRTSMIKNYEYWISKGKTPAEAEALVKAGQTIQIGGPAGAEEEFFKKKYERLGTEFAKLQERAGQAGANNLTINALKQLYQVAPTGPVTGRLLELFPEATDVSAAVQSLRTQLAPQLRVEGSGSTSDIEYSGMLNSLGSLKNSPEANAALLDLMLVKNELIQRKAEIASKVGMPPEQGGLTINQAEVAMLELDRKMWSENAMVTSIKQLIENAGGFTASSDGNTITTSGGLTVQFD